jgi:hypothetical protein
VVVGVADQVVPDRVGVPVGPAEQVLDPLGGRITQAFGQLPAVLPLDVREEPAEVLDRPTPGFAPGEVAAETFAHGIEFGCPVLHRRRGRSS